MATEDSKDKTQRAFISYLTHATRVLTTRPTLRETMVQEPLSLSYIDPSYRLRFLVNKVEDSTQFRDLCDAVDRAVGYENPTPSSIDQVESGYRGTYLTALKTFCRRSRFYSSAFANKQQDPQEYFNQFWSGLFRREAKITILKILDEVEFSSRLIDFGFFRIQRFTREELDTLIDRDVMDTFYSQATIDTGVLSQHSLLVADWTEVRGEGAKATPPVDVTTYHDWSWLQVQPKTPHLIIQLLAIHDWTPDLTEDECLEMAADLGEIQTLWPGPTISESLIIDDDIFSEPKSLRYSDGIPDQFRDGLPTAFPIPVSLQQENDIKLSVSKGGKVLLIAEQVKPHWDFIQVALSYLGKAFLAKPDLEQLLWNVAVLESLLSERAEVGQTMRRRISNILGSTDREKREIRKEFDELYDFRSNLVHGNVFTKKAGYEHLAKARRLARQVLSWVLDYLIWVDEDYRQRGINYEHYPRRDELLAVLDFDRGSLDRINRFIGRLPATFPKF